MSKSTLSDMLQITNVHELDDLLTTREHLRRLYATLQDAAAATSNPLYSSYLARVARMGDRINARIQDWFDRQAMQHGEYDELTDVEEQDAK